MFSVSEKSLFQVDKKKRFFSVSEKSLFQVATKMRFLGFQKIAFSGRHDKLICCVSQSRFAGCHENVIVRV
jgi:hypothetical protein